MFSTTLTCLSGFSRKLYELAGEDPETELPIVFIAAPAEWYHGILWEEMPERAWKTIPDRVRRELEALGLSRKPKENSVHSSNRKRNKGARVKTEQSNNV